MSRAPATRRWREVLTERAVGFVLGAAFPRLAYRLRWATRLGARGLIAYVAALTAFLSPCAPVRSPASSAWPRRGPAPRHSSRGGSAAKPTERELMEHLGYTRGEQALR